MELPTVLTRRLSGAPAFLAVAFSQLFSIFASTVVSFALGVWAYETSGAVLPIGVITVCQFAGNLAFGPIAGVLIDRYNRKYLMAAADALAALGTLFLFTVFISDGLQMWHLYAHALIVGISWAFQGPAYSAAIGTLVKKAQLNRANAIMSIVDVAPAIVAPILAGLMYPVLGLRGLFAFDLVTFGIAIFVMLFVAVPSTPETSEGHISKGSVWQEWQYGLTYIFKRPSLRNMLVVGLLTDVCIGLIYTLINTLVLARTNNNEAVLGVVWAAGAAGIVAGSIFLTVRSKLKDPMAVSLLLQAGWGGALLVYALANNAVVWSVAIFVAYFCGQVSLITGKSIWQAKVPVDVQGRVFAMRRTVMLLSSPITPIIAALLADTWLEPLFKTAGRAPQVLTALVGSGVGAGMAVIIACAAIGVVLFAAISWGLPSVRNADRVLPDKEVFTAPEGAANPGTAVARTVSGA